VGRRSGAEPSADLMRVANRRAAGNPLHLQSLVDEWLERGLIAVDIRACTPTVDTAELAAVVPGSLRQLIEQRLGRVPAADQELLEAAAVAGRQFSAASTAAALGIDPEECEARCSQLARRSPLVVAAGEHTWPDGTVTAVFRFDHDLYQEVVYQQVPPQRRARLHLQVGRRLEDGYGTAAPAHATELAMHFVRGRDTTRAITHLAHAARHAIGRNAHVEALEHVRVGLDLVTAMDDGPEHHEHELVLQTILGPLLIATRGWASPEVETAYERAHELARRSADPARALPPILYGLGSLHESRGEYQRAAEVLRQVLELEDIGSAAHHMGSHELLACSLFHQGRFDRAVDHAETGWDLYHPGLHLELQARYGYNPGVGCLTWGALSSWCLWETERANALMAEAFALAHDSDHMFSLASAHEQAAILHQLSEQPAVALDHAATALELGTRPGFRASGRHRTDPVGMVSGRAGRGRRGRRRTAQRDRGPPGHGGPHGPPVLPRAPRRILPSGRRDR
jgi:tetratricopeptide (TPR) repeat protein